MIRSRSIMKSFTVHALIIAENLGVEPAMVLVGMREGGITSLYERGVGDDAGVFGSHFLMVTGASSSMQKAISSRFRS